MQNEVKPIETLTLDNEVVSVALLPPELRELIAHINVGRQELMEAVRKVEHQKKNMEYLEQHLSFLSWEWLKSAKNELNKP